MLPLDLHVLSLSLAFILSQDQLFIVNIFIVLCSVCLAPKMILASDLLVYLYLSKGRN